MCFLISCIYTRVLCILAFCFDGESTAAIARVSEEYLVSHCTMECRQDGLPANRVRNRGHKGRNPHWYCNCPDCRHGFTRPHVFRRGRVNGLCNVRLCVLRQNQRRVGQRVETTLVLLVLVLIWLVARSTAEPLPSRYRECFAVSLATHSYSHKRKQLTSNKLAFSSGAKCDARLWEAMLTRANGALNDVERLTRLRCALQVNNTCL